MSKLSAVKHWAFDKSAQPSPLAPHEHPKRPASFNMSANKNPDFEGTFTRRSTHKGISSK